MATVTWSTIIFAKIARFHSRLKEGERYEFRVMAENAIGTSPALDTGGLAFLAKNPYDAPGAPPPPLVKEHDRDHITVSVRNPTTPWVPLLTPPTPTLQQGA